MQSTINSKQCRVSEWNRLIDNPTLADAIHNDYQLMLKSESMHKMLDGMMRRLLLEVERKTCSKSPEPPILHSGPE